MRKIIFTVISLIIVSLFALTTQSAQAIDYAEGSCGVQTINGYNDCYCDCPDDYRFLISNRCTWWNDSCAAGSSCWCASEAVPNNFTRSINCTEVEGEDRCSCQCPADYIHLQSTCPYYPVDACIDDAYCWCARSSLDHPPWPPPPYPDPPPDGGIDADCQDTNPVTGNVQLGICRGSNNCNDVGGEISYGPGTCRADRYCCVAEDNDGICEGNSGLTGDCIVSTDPEALCTSPRFPDGPGCTGFFAGLCCVYPLNPLPISTPGPGATIPPFQPSFCDPGELYFSTGIGCLLTTPGGFLTTLYRILLFLAGGVTLLLMIIGSFFILTSQGQPERVKRGKEIFTGAVTGLVFFIFATFLLELIGVDILGLF